MTENNDNNFYVIFYCFAVHVSFGWSLNYLKFEWYRSLVCKPVIISLKQQCKLNRAIKYNNFGKMSTKNQLLFLVLHLAIVLCSSVTDDFDDPTEYHKTHVFDTGYERSKSILVEEVNKIIMHRNFYFRFNLSRNVRRITYRYMQNKLLQRWTLQRH